MRITITSRSLREMEEVVGCGVQCHGNSLNVASRGKQSDDFPHLSWHRKCCDFLLRSPQWGLTVQPSFFSAPEVRFSAPELVADLPMENCDF